MIPWPVSGQAQWQIEANGKRAKPDISCISNETDKIYQWELKLVNPEH